MRDFEAIKKDILNKLSDGYVKKLEAENKRLKRALKHFATNKLIENICEGLKASKE